MFRFAGAATIRKFLEVLLIWVKDVDIMGM
jgi:hypothetical protein